METGTIKYFSPKKGYGFIAISDSDKDIFLHKTGIPLGITVNSGDKVAFEIVKGPKGPNAKIVRVLEGVSAR
ncbi:MAG TPA: cold shock domain-containing protein [SAR324 cluster bacterium]|jgi:CspA family cold shock protein|nr:cold shock domain-containing protein [SAR324 cluster bacterium]|tara:strand:+ start:379 stop:594 length:216 start_codon:yes stop_codon:yes gene_type:complete